MQSYRDCHREGVFPGLNCNMDGDRTSREIQTSRSSKIENNQVLKHRYIENMRRLCIIVVFIYTRNSIPWPTPAVLQLGHLR